MLGAMELHVNSTRTQQQQRRPLVRVRIGDGMELDDSAQLVSYEEYSPFGSVVYSAVYGHVEAPRKYRFAMYEHYRETEPYHCGLRYYCPWLGHWTSPNPLGDVDGSNLYEYVMDNPVDMNDPEGTLTRRRDNNNRQNSTADSKAEKIGNKIRKMATTPMQKLKQTARNAAKIATNRMRKFVGETLPDVTKAYKKKMSTMGKTARSNLKARLNRIPREPK